MAVPSLQRPHKLLYDQEGDDPTENPEAHRHRVIVGGACTGRGWGAQVKSADVTSVTSAHYSTQLYTVCHIWKEKDITAYRGSDRGHVTLHLRASVHDLLLRDESGALCTTNTTNRLIEDPATVSDEHLVHHCQ